MMAYSKIIFLKVILICFLSVETNELSISNIDGENIHSILSSYSEKGEHPAVTNLRQYLRLKSVQPNPNYENCIQWLKLQAADIGLEFNHVQFIKPDLFAIWLTWKGSNPSLKSILLNSHMDVAAVNYTNWIHDPFESYKDENGNIYARGSLDMKSTTVEQLEAIKILKNSGFIPLRTVHISILPDEEAGGMHGMRPFVNSKEFKSLNIGFDLDEGGSSGTDIMSIDYGQKAAWQVKFTATGATGHGASLVSGTAGEKIQIVIDKLMEFRKKEKDLIQNYPNFGSSNVTSVNLMRLGGGLDNNVLPDNLWAVFDIRIRIRSDWNFTDTENLLYNISKEAGPGVSYEFFQKSLDSAETIVDESNIWWTNLKTTFDKMNWKYQTTFLSATSDARYVRSAGIQALGFSPNIWTRGKIHQDNEFINENTFLVAIERYVIIIRNLTQTPASADNLTQLPA